MRRFEELFRKEFLQRERSPSPDIDRHSSKQSPHVTANRLKGMFFLKRKIETQERLRKSTDPDDNNEADRPPVEGVTLSPEKNKRFVEHKPHNFLTEKKTFSGKYLNKTLVPRRPSTRLENPTRIFNSLVCANIILAANRIQMISEKS